MDQIAISANLSPPSQHYSITIRLAVTAACAVITLVAWCAVIAGDVAFLHAAWMQRNYSLVGEALLFVALVSALVYGSMVYQLARLGYLRRLAQHRPPSEEELEAFAKSLRPPTVTILVPSYKEEPRSVHKTLLSAALQDYPTRSVVLLLDDPPIPTTTADRRALDEARRLPGAVAHLLTPLRDRLVAARDAFEQRHATGTLDLAAERRQLAARYAEVAQWFAAQAEGYDVRDHTDELFVELTFRSQSRRYREREAALLAENPDATELRRHYRRLAGRFEVSVTSFERKRYVNLSHEPNKAMNLNSYIGVMGTCVYEYHRDDDVLLVAGAPGEGGRAIPDSDDVLVLDADSVLHPRYALTLAHVLHRPEHARVAVVQTPYSAFPSAPHLLERVAGATTDIQYFLHQGSTYYGGTFWVGANALVRKKALEDIAAVRTERGFPIRTFIHDRTVIEDTESTVDLRRRGWQLHNYPERLAYSATPPDFGALLIQRRRWANGGLLIVPKLVRYLRERGVHPAALAEAFFRLHYLTSLAVTNIALLAVLARGFNARLASAWLPLTGLPYYALYAVDLCRAGYRVRDMLRVYALNLLLIPVNLGGVFMSLRQLCTRRGSPFARTPKAEGRTAAPAAYVLAEILLLTALVLGALRELRQHRQTNALFASVNAAFLLYAIARFIGLRALIDDLRPLSSAAWAWLAARAAWPPRAVARVLLPVSVSVLMLSPAAASGLDLAITVDDLPTHGPLPAGTTRERISDEFLRSLGKHRVPGVYGFVNGGQVEAVPQYSALLQRWLDADYALGNHTFSHLDVDRATPAEYLADLARNQDFLASFPGAQTPRVFRYPYLHEGHSLERRREIRHALHGAGYAIAQVTVDFFDWAWNEPYARCLAKGDPATTAWLRQGVVKAALEALDWSERMATVLVCRPVRHVLLLHIGALEAVVLDDLLTAYTARGVRFIPLTEALADPIYAIDPRVTWNDQRNFLAQLLRAAGRRDTTNSLRPPARVATLCR